MAHILIIDDESSIRSFMALHLERHGHRVSQAGNGCDALAMLANDPADLVVTDIVMPDKEGLETMIAIGRDWPDVPIIAMSGANESGLFLHASQLLGAKRTLPKPFSGARLVEAVNDALEQQRRVGEASAGSGCELR